MTKTLEQLSRIRSFLTSTLIWLVLLISLYTIYEGLSSKTYIVDPISVPDSLLSVGYSPVVLANWLVDGMQSIQSNTNSRKELNSLTSGDSEPDIEIPGSGISVKAISSLIRRALGIPERRIGGELVQVGAGRYRMHLRVNSPGEGARVIEVEGEIEDVMLDAAEGVMKTISPYLLAAHTFALLSENPWELDGIDPRYTTLQQIIELSLTNADPDDDAWGLNLHGAVQAAVGRHAAAISYYERALKIDPEFASAYWNWSDALNSLRRPDEALDKYDAAVKINSQMGAYDIGLLMNITVSFLSAGEPGKAVAQYDRVAALIKDSEQIDTAWRSRHAGYLVDISNQFYEFHRDFEGEDRSVVAGCKERMIAALELALSLTPFDARLLAELGQKYSYLGEYNKAHQLYEEGLQMNSDTDSNDSVSADICTRWRIDLRDAPSEKRQADFEKRCPDHGSG